MKKVKIGLIGLGFMGTTHYGIYQHVPGAEVVAVADVDPAKRSGDLSKVCGNIGDSDGANPFDFSSVKVFSDGFDLIALPELDVVDICCPTPDHAKYIMAALAVGKHVFCEKPLCRNREEMLKIRDGVRQSRHFFNVGMCVRAWPEYHHLHDLVQSGALGKITSARFTRLSPNIDGNAWENWYMKADRSGGALLDLHLHDTDFIRYVFGRPRAVSCIGARGVISDHGVDHVFTSYDFGSGPIVAAEGGWDLDRQFAFEMSFLVNAEKAMVQFGPNGYKIYWKDGRIETPKLDTALPTGWHQELNYFVDCVKNNITPDKYQTLDSILDSYAIVLAEEKAVQSGQKEPVNYV